MASPTVTNARSVSEPTTLRQDANTESSTGAASTIDTEHISVNDDPRQWSPARKVRVSRHVLCDWPDALLHIDNDFMDCITGYNGVCISFQHPKSFVAHLFTMSCVILILSCSLELIDRSRSTCDKQPG